MSIADHFDPRPDAGFVRSYDLQAARRQLQVSLFLVVVLGCAAIALAVMSRLETGANPQHPAALRGGTSLVAQSLLDKRNESHQIVI
ncbi:hypothetical protein Msil_2960 [Methylocella silvestris BL2]|uniref:Uncharacterized protein n=1 Tax=Methylocella silvestris (strain DSM 15510 / CIP 108128 / LMG 27833 / NCIMB 13906 / BL2) TaxID=395965 RepID=B8EIQ4_METSB|nr:hypothetical protein [Methylocella silvestris]ACK51871.1 hypothetical protein Msil_2960 [Methylocella silvestris BL2]